MTAQPDFKDALAAHYKRQRDQMELQAVRFAQENDQLKAELREAVKALAELRGDAAAKTTKPARPAARRGEAQ